MSAPPPKRPTDEQALAALQNFAKPQPKPVDKGPQAPEEDTHQSFASGFVGMVARGQIKASNTMPEADADLDASRIMPAENTPRDPSPASPAPRHPRPTPAPHPALPPILFTLAAILLLIALWAIGALIYMACVAPSSPEDIHYPLLAWDEPGGYTKSSTIMPWLMLAALPVAAILGFAGLAIKRRKKYAD